MKSSITVKIKSGKEIICSVEIKKNGDIKTQYPIDYAGDVDKKATYAIELTKEQVKNLLGINTELKTVKIRFNRKDWYDIKFEARKIKINFEKYITAKKLQSWIKNLEQKKDTKNSQYRSELAKKAKETGCPQVLSSVDSEKYNQDHWSQDRYVTYIRANGTTFTKEEKAEPKHY